MPESKVKSDPLGSITPYYHSRKRSICLFIIVKAPNVIWLPKSRLSVGVERSRTLLARATMAPDWTKLPGDGVAFLSLSLLFTFLGVCAIWARTYTSWFCTKRFRLDYWLSLFTFVRCAPCDRPKNRADHLQTLLCVSQAFFIVSIVFGIGAHAHGLRPQDIVVAMRTSWINMISAIIAIVTGKLSIIAFLDQIRGRHKGRPWFLWFIGGSNIVVNITVIITILLQCSPVEKLWDDRIPGDCGGRSFNLKYAYFQGSTSWFVQSPTPRRQAN